MTEFTDKDFEEIKGFFPTGLGEKENERWKRMSYAEKSKMLQEHRRYREITKFYYKHPERLMLPSVLIHPNFCPGSAMGVHGYTSALLLGYAIVAVRTSVLRWEEGSLSTVEISYGDVSSTNPEIMDVVVDVELSLQTNIREDMKEMLEYSLPRKVKVVHEIAYNFLPGAASKKLEDVAGAICTKIEDKIRDALRKCKDIVEESHKYEKGAITELEEQFGL